MFIVRISFYFEASVAVIPLAVAYGYYFHLEASVVAISPAVAFRVLPNVSGQQAQLE
jgi:hypothetical protein